MQLVLRVISEQAAQLGPQSQFVFSENGGSVGRSAGNDWVLPDKTKTVSGCHAVIRFQNGVFSITDTSTNGVFIDNEEVPLGRNQTAQLLGGETILIGRFRVSAEVHGRAIAQPTAFNTLAQPQNGMAMPQPQPAPSPQPGTGNPFGDLSPPAGQSSPNDPLSALSGGHPSQHYRASHSAGTPAPPAAEAPPPGRGFEFPMPNRPGGLPGAGASNPVGNNGDPLAGLDARTAFPAPAGSSGRGEMQPAPPPAAPPPAMQQHPAGGLPAGRGLPDNFSVDDLLKPRGAPAYQPPAPPPVPPAPPAAALQPKPGPDMGIPPQPVSAAQPPMPPAFDVPPPPPIEPAPVPPAPPLPHASGAADRSASAAAGVKQSKSGETGETDFAEALSNELMADLVALSLEAGKPAPEAEVAGARQTLDPITMLRQRAGSRNTRSSDVQTAMRARTNLRERLKPSHPPGQVVQSAGTTGASAAPLEELGAAPAGGPQGAPPLPPMPPASGPGAAPTPRSQPLPPVTPSSAASEPITASASPDGAFMAFWRGLGIDPSLIPPENRAQVLTELGRAIRDTADGLVSILQARRMIKDEFRLEQTTLQAGENNPLKFFKSGTEVLDHALVKRTEGFMAFDKAVQEGFQNMKEHEMAAMAGMQSAITGVLSRLDPIMFENEGKGLLGRSKDKAWERFVEAHERLSGDIEATTREVIAGDVSNAYERSRGGR